MAKIPTLEDTEHNRILLTRRLKPEGCAASSANSEAGNSTGTPWILSTWGRTRCFARLAGTSIATPVLSPVTRMRAPFSTPAR
jgi:hypothetical protein